jgi:hypothetical protein
MHARLICHAAAFALWLAAVNACAEPATIRTFAVPEHGSLQLSAPQSWPVEVRRSAPNHPLPTIAFGPDEGATYQVLITPLPPAHKGQSPLSAGALKKMVERAADDARSQALEKSLAVKELKSGAHVGYYFSATDRAPRHDEYKYMTQGMFGLGDMLITFTILTNDGYESVVPAALTMIRNAVELKDL